MSTPAKSEIIKPPRLQLIENENSAKLNLLDYDRSAMREYLVRLGEKPYRAEQLLKWIHQQGVNDFSIMTTFSKSFRQLLAEQSRIEAPECLKEQCSQDGTVKWLFKVSGNGNNAIETVFIPEQERGTLCVSSQVGCALNCSFCATARQGFNRNLTVAEIIGQVWQAQRLLTKYQQRITNVVMMGMGEPLLNFDAVVKAMNLMLDDYAYGLSKRRVTLSTSGVVPTMEKLSQVSDVSLAVSLHAPNDKLRDILVPINKKYPLKQLMDVCRSYFKNQPRRKVTFEYVMLQGINDEPHHARELISILSGVPAKMNLIPFNSFPGAPYTCSEQERINCFRDILLTAGINTITRKTRGADIDAACGQLAGEVIDRTKRSQRFKQQTHIKVEEAL